MLDQKTTPAGEFVCLLRYHPNHEYFAGAIGVRKVEGLCSIVVDVDGRHRGLVAPPGQLVERFVLGFDPGATGRS